MHISYRTFILIALFLLLIGCGINPKIDTSTNDDIQFTKLNTEKSIEQHPSNKAKDKLSKHDEITSINAVNTDKDIIITIEVHHLKRFQLNKTKEKTIKEMEKEFPKMKVLVSTDKKIIIEIEQLEQDIYSDSISQKELAKKVKKLKKLAKDQT